MMKRLTFALVILLSVFSGIVYYFFALNVRLVNQSQYDISSVECRSTSGDSWHFSGIERGQSLGRIMLVQHGSALTCDINIDGFASESPVVVGYFNEDVGKIHMVLKDEGADVVLEITEISGDQKKLDGKITLTRIVP